MTANVMQLNLVRFNNTKLDKMEELIKTLEEIKEHQMQTVQLARTTAVYKLADKAIKQALSLGAVVGRSEQFICPDCKKHTEEWLDGICEDCTLKGFTGSK